MPRRVLTPPNSTQAQAPRGLGIEHVSTTAGTSDIIEPPSRIPKAHSGHMFQVDQLVVTLRQSEAENQRLNRQLRDVKARHQQAVNVQVNLEEDLTLRDTRIEELQSELKQVKHRAHQTESELAEQTAEFMNSQSRWIKNVSQLNDEIASLKTKYSESQAKISEMSARDHAQTQSSKAMMQEKTKTHDNNENMRNQAHELEYMQNELLVKELHSRNQQLKDEMAHAQEVNARLQEENENFQLLVAKRVISGGFSLADDFANDSASSIQCAIDDSFVDETATQASVNSTQSPSTEYESSATTSIQSRSTKVEESGSPSRVKSSSNAEAAISADEPEGHQVQALKFEVTSLSNYNRALRTSLERLVHRLLVEHNGTFAKAVEDSVSSRSLSRFNTRIASSYEIPVLTPSRNGSFSGIEGVQNKEKSTAAAVLSQMMVNKQFTGNSNRRVISVGIDNEVRRAAPVLGGQGVLPHTPSPNSRPRKSMSAGVSAPIAFSSPMIRTPRISVPSSPNLDDDVVIELPKRIDNQTSLRRLHIKDD